METKEELSNEVNKFEILSLMTKFVDFEANDKNSEHYKGVSISGMINRFKNKNEEESVFNAMLINKHIGKLDNLIKNPTIKDLFYEKDTEGNYQRRENSDIDFLRSNLMDKSISVEPCSTNYIRITEHYSQLTLSEYKDISENKLNSMDVLTKGKPDNLKIDIAKNKLSDGISNKIKNN